MRISTILPGAHDVSGLGLFCVLLSMGGIAPLKQLSHHMHMQFQVMCVASYPFHGIVPLKQLSHHPHMQFQVLCVAYNPFHGELYSGAQESVIKVWDAVTGQLLRRLTGHKGWVTDLLYVPAARLLFSCSLDHTIKAWTDLGQEVQVRGHACQFRACVCRLSSSAVFHCGLCQAWPSYGIWPA